MASNKNGLVGATPVFRDGEKPCWISSTNAVVQNYIEVVSPDGETSTTIEPAEIVLQTDNGFHTGFITLDNGGNLVLTPDITGALRIFPGGSSNGGIVMSSSSVASATIAPFDNSQTQLFAQASMPVRVVSGTGTSGIGMGEENTGVINYVTVTSAGGLTLQFQGSGLVAGSYLDFVLNPASFAGATVNFTVGTTVLETVIPSSAAANTAISRRYFTPDGTTFFKVV